MKIDAPDRPSTTVEEVVPEASAAPAPSDGRDVTAQGEIAESPISSALTSVVAFLSGSAAAIAAATLFEGLAATLVALGGAALGSGMVWFSLRTKQATLIQFLIVPAAAVVGAILLIPDARGGTANLPGLIGEALRSGGIAQPPVPFDPGWRFLLLVVMAIFSGASAGVATGLNRVKLAVFIPVPLLFGALMAQTGDAAIISTIAAVVLLVAALAVAFGVELAREGATSGRFEIRRLAKGAASLVALVALLFGVMQLGFLFPDAHASRVVPPQRPEPQPPEPDRQIFVVTSPRQLPWRIGVLDGYDGRGWLTPPFDTARLVDVPTDGSLPEASDVPGAPVPPVSGARAGDEDALSVTFTISDITGHVVPVVANPKQVAAEGFDVQYDPRTQTLRLPSERASEGMRYTVEAPVPPEGKDLATAGAPPGEMEEFLSVPPAPPAVQSLIAEAPRDTDLFTRLQFVRDRLYEKVIAKGAGQAADVPPERVVELLEGKPGTPFEITAAEALLARWVGVPSRIGYGYFGGDDLGEHQLSIRPRHAATWLEVYFQGFGWVPIVGTPPRAQSSLSSADKNYDPSVVPAENLTLFSYVPVRSRSTPLLYTIIQYWVGRTLPFVVLACLALWLYPGFLKMRRRAIRRAWAAEQGPAERILVAYAEFRDATFDFGLGHPTLTPLEFVAQTEDDAEHRELAWLVTRALWGDLIRDLREEDAMFAEDMARSMTTRLRVAQQGLSRIFAFGSRNSLNVPFNDDIPNLWWPRVETGAPLRARLGRRIKGVAEIFRAATRRALPAASALLMALLMSGCVQDVDLTSSEPAPLPERIAPETLDGLELSREPAMEEPYTAENPDALVSDARVYSVRDQGEVVAALQVVAFKEALEDRQDEARAGVLEELGGSEFELHRLGNSYVYMQRLAEQQFFLWFPPEGAYYEMFIARNDFERAPETFAGILGYQLGETVGPIVVPPDPRRGFPG